MVSSLADEQPLWPFRHSGALSALECIVVASGPRRVSPPALRGIYTQFPRAHGRERTASLAPSDGSGAAAPRANSALTNPSAAACPLPRKRNQVAAERQTQGWTLRDPIAAVRVCTSSFGRSGLYRVATAPASVAMGWKSGMAGQRPWNMKPETAMIGVAGLS